MVSLPPADRQHRAEWARCQTHIAKRRDAIFFRLSCRLNAHEAHCTQIRNQQIADYTQVYNAYVLKRARIYQELIRVHAATQESYNAADHAMYAAYTATTESINDIRNQLQEHDDAYPPVSLPAPTHQAASSSQSETHPWA
jgi:hypothetical protein